VGKARGAIMSVRWHTHAKLARVLSTFVREAQGMVIQF
jgi:hypothetical protein